MLRVEPLNHRLQLFLLLHDLLHYLLLIVTIITIIIVIISIISITTITTFEHLIFSGQPLVVFLESLNEHHVCFIALLQLLERLFEPFILLPELIDELVLEVLDLLGLDAAVMLDLCTLLDLLLLPGEVVEELEVLLEREGEEILVGGVLLEDNRGGRALAEVLCDGGHIELVLVLVFVDDLHLLLGLLGLPEDVADGDGEVIAATELADVFVAQLLDLLDLDLLAQQHPPHLGVLAEDVPLFLLEVAVQHLLLEAAF